MPAGQVIGRVSIKVLPDTTDFRRQAQKALDKIEKTLEVTVNTKADMTGAKRDLLEGIKEINTENRTRDSRKIRFQTTISTNGMNDAIRKAVRDLQNRARGKKIKFEVDDLAGTAKIELELDDEAKRKAKEDLDHWARSVSPIKVKVEPDLSAVGSRATAARLAVLTHPRTVSIIPKLNDGAVAKVGTALAALSGARVLNDIFEELGDKLLRLDQAVPIIGSLAAAIAGLAAFGLSAASNLFALSSSLAQIGPAALLLPGLFGGIAVGVGVTIAALKDFNKELPEVKAAMSGLQDTISQNFWDKAAKPIRSMIDELLPEFTQGIAKTATQIGGFFGSLATDLKGALNPFVKQMFDDLAKSIKVATDGTGAFANIIAVLGKVGTSYLPQLAGWFVDISKQFSDFLTKAEKDGSLKGWIDTGIQNLKDLGSVLFNLGGIFAGVSRAATEAGGTTLHSLAQALEGIHKAVDSPGFQHGLVDVFTAAHQAMSNIANVSGPAVKSLFVALGKLLTDILPQVGNILGGAVSAIADALAQPAISNGIKDLFNGLQQAVVALMPVMRPLGAALGALLGVVGQFATILGPLVATALTPILHVISALAPAIQPVIALLGGALTQIISNLTPIFQQLVPVIGTALVGAMQAIQGVMPQILSSMHNMLGAVGPLIGALASGLAPILPVLAKLFATIYVALEPLVTALAQALAPILPILGQALAQIIAALTPILAIAIQIVVAVIKPLLPALSQIIQSILPPLADAIQRLLEAIQPLLQALLGLVNFLMPILVPILTFIIKLLAESLVAAINGVALVFEGLTEIVTGVWNTIKGVIEIAWGLIKGIFTGNFDTLKKGWSDFWHGLWSFVKGIWDTILGGLEAWLNIGILGAAGKGMLAIRDGFKAGWEAIKGLSEAAWNAFKGSFTSFGSGLANIGRSMMSSLRGLIADGWNAVRSATSTAWDAIKGAVTSGVSKAVDVVKGLPSKCRDALGSLGSVLINAGKQLISGFVNGIKSAFNSVKDTLGNLTDKLTSWKGPEPKDKVLLVQAGQLIIGGLIKGLESQYDKVKQSLQGLTKDIPDTASAALKNTVTADQKQLLGLANSWDKISDKLSNAKDKLSNLEGQHADLAKQIKDSIVSATDVTEIDGGFSDITKSLRQAKNQTADFADVLAKLKKRGLNKTVFDQLAQAGPEAGMAAAQNILASGRAGIDQINKLSKGLAKQAGRVGDTTADVMFNNGIHIAEGLVKGLQSQADKIEKTMLRIADSMVKAIKAALGIHSPSRVFAELGSFVGQGFSEGLRNERDRVHRAMQHGLLDAVPTSVDRASVTGDLTSALSGALNASGSEAGGVTKVLNYYAAPGSSISSEEDLFAAANRARFGW